MSYAEVLYGSEADDSEDDAEESGVENEEEDEVLNVALAKYYFLDFKVAP